MTPDQLKASAEKYATKLAMHAISPNLVQKWVDHDSYEAFLAGAELMRSENALLKKRVEVLEAATGAIQVLVMLPHQNDHDTLLGKCNEALNVTRLALAESSRIAKGEV